MNQQYQQSFTQALLAYDRVGARELVRRGAEEFGPLPFLERVVVPTLERIGREWEEGTLALAQVYMSGKICEELVDGILPAASPQRIVQPPMAIALLSDYHSLGKTVIRSALRASGFELRDLGRVEAAELLAQVVAHETRILLVSVLMLPSALRLKELCTALRAARPGIKIVVGGAPFRLEPQLWREVGADATGKDSAAAIKVVRKIIKELA